MTARFELFPQTDVQRAYRVGRGEGFTLGGIGSHLYREYEVDDLDVPRLEAAVDALVARHDMLRAVFGDDGTQRVLPEVPPFRLEFVEDPRERFSHHVFDPASWPLFSLTAARRGDRTVLAIGTDNLVFDAPSTLTFYSELGALYTDPAAELPSVGLTFRDYVLSPAPDSAKAERYWAELAPQLPPGPRLPLAVDPAEITAPRFTRRSAGVPRERWQEIVARVRTHGLNPSAVLLTAFAEVLGRWSARPDLTVNVRLFDRREVHPDIHQVIGDFTSSLLVDHHPEAGESWLAATRRLQHRMWDAQDHCEVSAVRVLRDLARENGVAEVSMPVVFTSALGLPSSENPLLTDQVYGISQTPQVWLDHQVSDVDGGVELVWDAVEELFPDALLDEMFDAYQRLVEWLAIGDWTTSAPDLLPDGQRETRRIVNATDGAEPECSLHDEFFRRAAEKPDRPALLYGDEVMTYGELADRALRVAAALDIVPGEPVVVSQAEGPDQIAAVLGVLAAGGAYVPIGVDQPDARRARMGRLAGVRRAVTGDFVWAAQRRSPATPVPGDPDRLAYVIFTSGSTGPQGVEITHRAAMNTIADVSERFGIGEDDRVLALSALDFDLSVYDVFGLLSAGGALVLVEEDARHDAHHWLELVRRHDVTVWNTVPALLDMVLAVTDVPLGFRVALICGDRVGLDLPGRLAAHAPSCRFVALGGATEASIWSNFFEVRDVDPAWRSVPYGYPLRNQRYRVVDSFDRDCPDWVEGELWIGGSGVALGYRGAPEQTADRFRDGWYRTGDLGRYRPDGSLEFLGRRDRQVKLRGHRVELGEVEAALSSARGVGSAVAVVADGTLLAAVVPAAPPTPSEIVDASARDLLASVTEEVDLLARQLDHVVEVAEWGVPAGLKEALGDRVRVTTLDGPLEFVPSALRRRFEVVLANAVLCRYPDVRHGAAVSSLLVRPGGLVVAVEPEESARRWAEEFAAAGLAEPTYRTDGATGLAVVSATLPVTEPTLEPFAVRAQAGMRVPAHMLPERVEVLPWLPLSANGKVDRDAVTRLLLKGAGEDDDAVPRGADEQVIAALWSDLGVPVTGRTQNFFALGGDSLLMIRFVQLLEMRYGVVLPLRKLLAGPTVAQAAVLFAEQAAAEEGTL